MDTPSDFPKKTGKMFDPQTDKRIHDLLLNENDEVSEQDIQNIRTDIVIQETEVTEVTEDDSDEDILPDDDSGTATSVTIREDEDA